LTWSQENVDRQKHQAEVRSFLQKQFPGEEWEFSIPGGSGNETYFARSAGRACFIKLGAQVERYQALAGMGLTPEVLASGRLEDSTSILVQAFIIARKPTRKDYRIHLEQFAAAIAKYHASPELKQALPQPSSGLYRRSGLEALKRVRERWEGWKGLVPHETGYVGESLDRLEQKVSDFEGSGLVASHNDICNANWLTSPDGKLYLVDLESMELDDPAVDIGATLWWYYPPALRERFLLIAGHSNEGGFEERMRVRMTLHCLSIILPRPASFDEFDPREFGQDLTDFRACLEGKENPQGYEK
jgi:thiamine kinase-like enzyme